MHAAAVKRGALALAVVAATLALDLGTKSWAASDLRRGGARTVVEGHLSLRYAENTGAAFSVLQSAPGRPRRIALVGVSATAVVAIAIVLARRIVRGTKGVALPAGLTLLLAGTLGNLYDRVTQGWVVDFIDWRIAGRWRWPTFNVADVAISVGIAAVLLHGLMGAGRQRPSAGSETPA